jgi:hypothetical protein
MSPGARVHLQKVFISQNKSTAGANYLLDYTTGRGSIDGGEVNTVTGTGQNRYMSIDNGSPNYTSVGYKYAGAISNVSTINATTSNWLGFVYKEVFGDIRFAIGDVGDRGALIYLDQLVAAKENGEVGYDSYTVTYKNMDGSDDAVLTVPQNAPLGDALLMDYLPIRTRQGYNFGYWTTKPNDGTPVTQMVQLPNKPTGWMGLVITAAANGTPVTKFTLLTSNIDLYPVWTNTDTYVIVYDVAGGKFNDAIPAANGGGSSQPMIRAITPTSDLKKLDDNGNQHSAHGYPGQGVQISPNVPSGSFRGWYTNTEFTGTNYENGNWEVQTVWNVNKSIILYARW